MLKQQVLELVPALGISSPRVLAAALFLSTGGITSLYCIVTTAWNITAAPSHPTPSQETYLA